MIKWVIKATKERRRRTWFEMLDLGIPRVSGWVVISTLPRIQLRRQP